ncbi:MAG: hypothetical protein Q9167_001399 [Letrouitia subvulpina]
MSSARDVPLLVTSASSSSEKRITPSWSLSILKAKLEPITGIPPSLQKLSLRLPGQKQVVLEAQDEGITQIGAWPLVAYAELHVSSLDPSSNLAIPPPADVPKYEMPAEIYSSLPDTVLAYKRSHKIGRFDPHASENQELKVNEMWKDIHERNFAVATRCILPPGNDRRGTIASIGLIPELPGEGPWIGVRLDEPTGKNDGTVNGRRYFECGMKHGVFVRPERVDVGDWPELGIGKEDSDLEEI